MSKKGKCSCSCRQLIFAGLFGLLIATGITCNNLTGQNKPGKITGVNFVGPAKKMEASAMKAVSSINAQWIAVNPYAMSKKGFPQVTFNFDRQWWGERSDGIITTISYAQAHGLMVMVKPQVWVGHEGWTGTFSLSSEEDWKIWEQQYEKYILTMVAIADSMNTEIFCMGTEFKTAVEQRPEFWKQLIAKIRKKYQGELTYAANWDNYKNITFWDQLDYIGIDAYFPLSDIDIPVKDDLLKAWETPVQEMESLQSKYAKPILFTEYGYRSIPGSTGEQWKLKESWETDRKANMKVQVNGYEALYRTFWNKEWFAGGFIWKWYDYHSIAGGLKDTDYTPQNKPVEKVISKWYQ